MLRKILKYQLGNISLDAKVKIWLEIVPIFYPQQPAKWIQLKVEVFVWNVTFIDFDCYPLLLLLLYCYGIWWRIVAAFWRWRQSCNPFHERIRAFFPNKLLMTVLAWKNSTKSTFLFLTSFYVTIFFILDTKSFQVGLLFSKCKDNYYTYSLFLQFEQNGF